MLRGLYINVDKKTYEDIHKLIGMTLQNEEGITVFNLFEHQPKQQSYREILRAGIQAKLKEFEEAKNKFEQEGLIK